MTPRPKPFKCTNCGESLGQRQGNDYVTDRSTVPFDRSRKVLCNKCGVYTVFSVSRKNKIEQKAEVR